MKASIMGRDISRGSCGVTPSDNHRWLSAICGDKATARIIVFYCVRNFNTGQENVQTAVPEWYCNTSSEWFSEAIGKLPTRRQRYVDLGVGLVNEQLFNIQQQDIFHFLFQLFSKMSKHTQHLHYHKAQSLLASDIYLF
jgi:hypothetical protein